MNEGIQLANDSSIPMRCPDDQKAAHAETRLLLTHCCDLALQAAKIRAEVGDEVDDFDHRDFVPALQEDVDEPLDTVGRCDGNLRPRRPTSGPSQLYQRLLPAEVLHVTRWRRAGRQLQEGCELKSDPGRQRRPCLDRRVAPYSTLGLADEALGHSREIRELLLCQAGPPACGPQRGPEAVGQIGATPPAEAASTSGSLPA